MSKLPPLRSIRLLPRTNYERFTGVRGELFYDPVNDTIRVFDSQTQGGSILATQTWITSEITAGFKFRELAPQNARGSQGDLAGTISITDEYLYYCYSNYTDGESAIWSRVLLDNSDWA